MPCCTASPLPIARVMSTPQKAAGTEPIASHFTSERFTVPRRRCTSEPTGFITAAATRSLETAVRGGMPKKITSTGVMSAPTAHAREPDDDADSEGGGDQDPVDVHGSALS